MISKCADDYRQNSDVEFSIPHVLSVSQLGDRLNQSIGVVRVSARHIKGADLSSRSTLVDGLKSSHRIYPSVGNPIIDHRARGVIPVYRCTSHPTQRVRGSPYKRRQVGDAMGEIWKDVSRGRILACSAKTITEYDHIVCAPPSLVANKFPPRAISTEIRLRSDVRSVINFLR